MIIQFCDKFTPLDYTCDSEAWETLYFKVIFSCLRGIFIDFTNGFIWFSQKSILVFWAKNILAALMAKSFSFKTTLSVHASDRLSYEDLDLFKAFIDFKHLQFFSR